jgi:pyrroline-5-carboxylate reductase
MKVLVIGAGNMGLTYAEAMSRSKLLKKRNLMILDSSPEKILSLKKTDHFDVYENLGECMPKADLVFVAVKPFHSAQLFQEMKPLAHADQIIISIMAGVTIRSIQEGTGIQKVVRAMPNLPAQVGKGVTSYTAAPEVSRIELLTIENLLDTTGKSIQVSSENFIDASTGISGSGPAYVFYFMQSMLEAALKMGFSPNDSKLLVSHTFEGAVELFNQSDLSPNSWMERVASKGGTTRAALDSMEDNNVKELIKDAAYAAFKRAVELGKEK